MTERSCKRQKREPGCLEVLGLLVLFLGGWGLVRVLFATYVGDHVEANFWATVAAYFVWIHLWNARGWRG